MRMWLCLGMVVLLAGCPDKNEEAGQADQPAHPLLVAKCKAGTASACKELEEKCEGGDQTACDERKKISSQKKIPMKPPPGEGGE